MATAHLATAQAFRQLAPQAAALLAGGVAGGVSEHLDGAAGAADRAGQAWADVRARWRGIRTARERGPADAIRREAADLTTRIGRLVHTDPAWQPRLDADTRLRTGDELAADPTTLWGMLNGLRRLNAAILDVSTDHVELIRALHGQRLLLVRTRSLPAGFDTPRPWTNAPGRTVQELAAAQHHAVATSRQTWVRTAGITDLTPPRHRRDDPHTLEARRLAVTADIGVATVGRHR